MASERFFCHIEQVESPRLIQAEVMMYSLLAPVSESCVTSHRPVSVWVYEAANTYREMMGKHPKAERGEGWSCIQKQQPTAVARKDESRTVWMQGRPGSPTVNRERCHPRPHR